MDTPMGISTAAGQNSKTDIGLTAANGQGALTATGQTFFQAYKPDEAPEVPVECYGTVYDNYVRYWRAKYQQERRELRVLAARQTIERIRCRACERNVSRFIHAHLDIVAPVLEEFLGQDLECQLLEAMLDDWDG